MSKADEMTQVAPLPVWARKATVKQLTGCPDKWIYGFAAKHKGDIRRFGSGGKNGTLIFRLSAVLAAIEDGFSVDDADVSEALAAEQAEVA